MTTLRQASTPNQPPLARTPSCLSTTGGKVGFDRRRGSDLRRPLRPWAVIVALAALVVTAACGTEGATTDDASGSDATTAGDSAPTTAMVPHGLGPPPTNEDGSVPSTVVLPQSPLGPWSLAVESSPGFPDGGGPAASLVAVRTGVGDGTQRLVFEFAGDTAPGWQVGYESLPVLADPTGDPVAISGTEVLVVRMTPASTVDLADGSATPTYDGPTRLGMDGGTPATEVVLTGDFEGLMTWVVGLERRVPFVVDTLEAPTRLVVDLLATGT